MNTNRDPYVFQIGFDFGTAYSKCVIRDLNYDRVFVYIPEYRIDESLPFLFPSVVQFENKCFSLPQTDKIFYHQGMLSYPKLALESIVNGKNKDIIDFYALYVKKTKIKLDRFIFLTSVYFISKSISEIKRFINLKFPDYGNHENDTTLINMCIPVSCANEDKVNYIFFKSLKCSWGVSNSINTLDKISVSDFDKIVSGVEENFLIEEEEEYICYTYPEVSANMQGFVRSRVSSPGTYLFSDIGAGTVDQCIFIFDRMEKERVIYISAEIFPLGSSVIERKAFDEYISNNNEIEDSEIETMLLLSLKGLKELMSKVGRSKCKELGELSEIFMGYISNASKYIEKELSNETKLNYRRSLKRNPMLDNIKLIFGGGGNTEHPYEQAVRYAFYSPDNLRLPEKVNLLKPTDLEKDVQEAWLPRLSVAYGLSYPKYDLHEIILPKDFKPVTIKYNKSYYKNYISKDEC